MNMYTNTKKSKKFILILVLLMLFNFVYPKQVKAIDFLGNISSFFFLMERGVISLINNIFCDDAHAYKFDPNGDGIKVYLTAESIIKGKFVLFDADIFKEVKNWDDSGEIHRYYDDGKAGNWVVKSKTTLRNTIAGWYYNLLNFAIVSLLSVLVYVGIRMLISTISQDKAKYKIMFKDWLVALCILIAMHYIMIGILTVTSKITETIGTDGGDGNQLSHIMSVIYRINENESEGGWWTKSCNGEEEGYEDNVEGCRFHTTEDGVEKHYTMSDAFAYEILLGFIAVITVLFMWKYLKREFTVIFLILLGPISCITYPIDKISDGKAQAFNKWLTEFIYNVLIQPFHLLLYLVLVGSAVKLANENLIYGLACLAMLIPAEKFVKEMFGFKDKLGSPLGAMAAGAAGGHLLSKMGKGGSSGSSGGNNNAVTTIKNKDVDKGLLTSGGGAEASASAQAGATGGLAVHAANQESIQQDTNTADDRLNEAQGQQEENRQFQQGLEEGIDDSENTAELDNGTPQDGELPEGHEDGAPQTRNLPEGEDSGAPADTPQPSNNAAESSGSSNSVGRTIKGFAGRLWEAHNQRATEKHGQAQFWKRQGVKAGKGVRALAKVGIKGATALTGGFTSAILGKGFIAGAATGWAVAGRGINSASNVVKDYADRMRTPEQREKKAFKDFKTDKAQIQKARESFMERHEGRPPTADEFEQEMKDRFAMARYGMKDDQIDDLIDLYQDTDTNTLETAALQNGISKTELDEMKENAGGPDNLDKAKYRAALEEKLSKINGGQAAIEKAKAISGSKTAYTSKLGKRTSAKDLIDPKAVSYLYNDIFKGLKAANPNCTDEEADRCAREYLTNVGKIHSVGNVAFPPPLEVQLPPEQIEANNAMERLVARGVEVSSPEDQVVKQEIKLYQDAIEAGFDDNLLAQFSNMAQGNNQDYTTLVETAITMHKEYKTSPGSSDISALIGNGAETTELNEEIVEVLSIQHEFNVNTDKALDMREFEHEVAKGNKEQVKNVRRLGKKAIKNDGKVSKKDATTHTADEIALAEIYADKAIERNIDNTNK